MNIKECLQYYQVYKVGILNLKKKSKFIKLSSENVKSLQKFQRIVEMIDQALEHLPENERLFVRMKYFQKMSMPELAKRFGCSERHLFRLQLKILEQLELELEKTASQIGTH